VFLGLWIWFFGKEILSSSAIIAGVDPPHHQSKVVSRGRNAFTEPATLEYLVTSYGIKREVDL
jgi:hypothetical protein